MSFTSLVPALAALGFLGFASAVLVRDGAPARRAWLFPASLSLVFLLFSLFTIGSEGLFGFWAEHTRSLWGNQVWLDLLLAIGVAWSLVVPEAKALGLRLPLWLGLVLCTGCIGLLALVARVQYLQARSSQSRGHAV